MTSQQPSVGLLLMKPPQYENKLRSDLKAALLTEETHSLTHDQSTECKLYFETRAFESGP